MSASMTFRPSHPIEGLVDRSLAALVRLTRQAFGALSRRSEREPRDAQEVLDWAHAISSTQPTFASELRAAALRHLDEKGR